MEDRKFIVTDAEGNEKEMLILFTTKFEEFGKSYIFYHDFNVEGQAQVYVSTFDENGNLGAVETEEEWVKLEEIFKQFTEEQAQKIESYNVMLMDALAYSQTDEELDEATASVLAKIQGRFMQVQEAPQEQVQTPEAA